jgi:hypothetical protein
MGYIYSRTSDEARVNGIVMEIRTELIKAQLIVKIYLANYVMYGTKYLSIHI